MAYYISGVLHVTFEDFFFSVNIIFIHFHKLDTHFSLKIGLIIMFIDFFCPKLFCIAFFILQALKQANFPVNHIIFIMSSYQIIHFENYQ